MKLKDFYIEISLFVVLLLNLFYHIIPQIVLFPVLLVCAYRRLNKIAIAFLLLVALKDIIHAFMFLNFHISGFAYIAMGVGIYFMWNFLVRHSIDIVTKGQGLILIMLYLMMSCLVFGNLGTNSSKPFDLLENGIILFVAFYYIFKNKDNVDFYLLAVYCCLFALYLLQLNVVANSYGSPRGIFDLGFYRLAVGTDMYTGLAKHGVKYATHYQYFGFLCTLGAALALMFAKMNLRTLLLLLCFNIFAIGYTGARQFLLIMVLIFSIYILRMKISVTAKILVGFIILIFAGYMIYSSVMSEYVLRVSEQGIFAGSGREDMLQRGIELFKSSQLFGVGFGGYNYMGSYKAYPHNIVVELLAEVGLIGTAIILLICLFHRKNLNMLFAKKISAYYLLIVLILRALISASLGGNIIIFSAFFALQAIPTPNGQNKELK